MNWSAAGGGAGAAGVVTVTSTVPVPAGEVAVMRVPTDHGEAGGGRRCRSRRAVAPVKPVPVMVTVVPPAAARRWG